MNPNFFYEPPKTYIVEDDGKVVVKQEQELKKRGNKVIIQSLGNGKFIVSEE